MELSKVSGTSSRIVKILLSVAVSSLLLSSLPFLFEFLNQFSANKSYVFLFCNVLMIFIAKNSPLPSDNSSSHQFNDQLDVAAPVHNSQERDMSAAYSAEQQEEEKRMIVSDSQEEDEVIAEIEKEEEEEKRMIVEDFPQEEEEVTDTEREEDEEEGSNNGIWTSTEEEEEVEELNKKCEDFIRKMKAAFRSEPFYHQTPAMGTVR